MTLEDFKNFLYKERQAVDVMRPFDFYDWMFADKSGTIRKGWGIFFSVGLGMFLAFYAFTDATVMLAVALIYAIGVVQFATYKPAPTARTQPKSIQPSQVIALPPIRYGVIYVMKRSDGVYKIGKTHYLRNRLQSHRIDYGQGFDVVASWVVPDADRYERVALDLTSKYHFSEDRRKELRQMDATELNNFVLTFTERVYDGFKKTAQN